MPKMRKDGSQAKSSELPSTLRRSSPKAQRTFAKAHDAAAEEYGDGERAHRVAYAALKHAFEKRDGRWVAKDEKGPSDPRASSPRAREGEGETYGGVDVAGHTRDELYARAKELGIPGRSRMTKHELGKALQKAGG